MDGIQPVIVGLILYAVISMGMNVLFPNGNVAQTVTTVDFWKSIVIFVVSICMLVKKVHPIKTLLTSGVLGIILGGIL